MKKTISAVVVTLNEEKNIKKCLESLSFVDEIVLVDDGSTDKTVEIAKKFTDKIYHHKSVGYVEPARNFVIEKATGDWILILDADESIPQSLAKELKNFTNSEEFDVVWIPRKNIIFGKWIKNNQGWWPDFHPRFFKKGKIVWTNKIHGKPEIKGNETWLAKSEELAIEHNNYRSVFDFIERLNRYTNIESKEATGASLSIKPSDFFTKPNEEFLSRFFAREGYKDGLHGLVLSLLEGVYSLVNFAKIWEEQGLKEEKIDLNNLRKKFKRMYLENEYWFLLTVIKESNNPFKKLYYIILHKIVSLRLQNK